MHPCTTPLIHLAKKDSSVEPARLPPCRAPPPGRMLDCEVGQQENTYTGCDCKRCGTTARMQGVEQHKEQLPRVAVGLKAGKDAIQAPAGEPFSDSGTPIQPDNASRIVDGRSTTWGDFRQTGKAAFKQTILLVTIISSCVKNRDTPRYSSTVWDGLIYDRLELRHALRNSTLALPSR